LSLDNEIDGHVLLKLSEAMVVRLFPTIKLEVQFLDLLQSLRQRHTAELNSKKTFTSSSPLTNGRPTTNQMPVPVLASSSFDHGNGHSSNSNSPKDMNGHHQPPKPVYSDRSQISKGQTLKAFKREPKYLLAQALKYEKNKLIFIK
jgi:hypothetical protein